MPNISWVRQWTLIYPQKKCHKCPETIDHILSACGILARTKYLERHNQVVGIIHQNLITQTGIKEDTRPYYQYEPASVEEDPRYRVYWDRIILSDRTVSHNRPDIILVDKEEKITYLTEAWQKLTKF